MSDVLFLLGYGLYCIVSWEIVKPHADKSARAFRRWINERRT